MERKIGVCGLFLFVLTVVVSGSCVSEEKYRMKERESEKLSGQLTSLKSEKNDLEKERTELRLKVLSLEGEMTRLKQDNTNLEEILKAKSGTLSKEIADLRKQNKTLREENEALQAKAKALEVEKTEEILGVKTMYEDLVQDMESEIKKGKITITQLKGKLKVNMVDEILFDSGRATIKAQGVKVLERVGKVLLNVKDQTIRIEGHTDNVPIGPELAKRYPTNWELSVARAIAVARYLQEEVGVDPRLISATGHGQYQPIASNETEQGRTRNRRIEIVLVPKDIAPSERK
ncbi:MAG: OmpA family protein [Deltaproteobacteria bacterium]|nr:MAG: OmpA family protein [Deltaproteobacteria bacterium]